MEHIRTALDLRILEIGTSEEEVTISAEIGDCGLCVYAWSTRSWPTA